MLSLGIYWVGQNIPLSFPQMSWRSMNKLFGQPNMCVCSQSLSRIRLFVTPRTVACQASLSMEFSRQEYWGGLPFPSPGDLPNQWFEPTSPALAGGFFTSQLPGKPMISFTVAQEYQIGWHTLDCIFYLLSYMATRVSKVTYLGKKPFFFF